MPKLNSFNEPSSLYSLSQFDKREFSWIFIVKYDLKIYIVLNKY
jgi:hypothetical protein